MAQASRDQNFVVTLLAVSNVDGVTPVVVYADPVTHRLLVDATGASNTKVTGEVVAGSGTSWTLAHSPVAGTVALFANGQRLTETVDYSIVGANITTVLSWTAGTVIADYEY